MTVATVGQVSEEAPSSRLTQPLSARQLTALDVALAVFLFIGTAAAVKRVPERAAIVPPDRSLDGARYAVAAVVSVALVFRRRHPVPVAGVVGASVAALVALGVPGPSHTAVAFAIYSAAVQESGRRSRLALVGAVIAMVEVGAFLAPGGPEWSAVVAGPAVVLVGWLAGQNVRARRSHARAATERARQREREREDRVRQAAAEERLRIARELHDIVAHSMSLIAVRSGAARVVIDRDADEARRALEIIENTSRRALREMRHLVGVLRQPEDDRLVLEPTPGLGALEELVRQIDEGGTSVELVVEGRPRALPSGLDVSAYRIAQEALTNVVRHAPHSRARLSIRYGPADIEVEISNDGGAPRHEGATDGSGHGLVGMRERVALYGGELSAGPTSTGYRVLARLPIEDENR